MNNRRYNCQQQISFLQRSNKIRDNEQVPYSLTCIGIARYWHKNGYEYEAGALLDVVRSLLPMDAFPLVDQIKSTMANRRLTEADSLLGLLQNRVVVK